LSDSISSGALNSGPLLRERDTLYIKSLGRFGRNKEQILKECKTLQRGYEPVGFYSEIGGDKYEVRKIILYRDGRIGYATEDVEAGEAILGELPIPDI
jgi:hypothetical protein